MESKTEGAEEASRTQSLEIAATTSTEELEANEVPLSKRRSTVKGVTWSKQESTRIPKQDINENIPRVLTDESLKRQEFEKDPRVNIILPWTKFYKAWWGISVAFSVMTILFETYQIAFSPAGLAPHGDASSIIGFLFMAVFTVDIIVNFNLAYYDDDNGELVTDRKKIAKSYLQLMFWVDFIGVFPFYLVALAISGEMGQDTDLSRYLSLLGLLRLVRLHRVKQVFDTLQYNTRVSLRALTLIRNFGAALVWTHFAACAMYFIARQYDYHEEDTWIGGLVYGQSPFERYITAMYWSVVTFTTVGYGDFSPVNPAEQIFGMIYMLTNMVLSAWMIGSITLLIVKKDKQTSLYRDTLTTLQTYSNLHNFDRRFRKRLQAQAKLYFNNRQVADEEVLKNLPLSVRRKVLRRLYLPYILQSRLMKGVRQQFVDAFLSNCTVEIFSSGEEILSRGCSSSLLYLLVEGTVKILDPFSVDEKNQDTIDDETYASSAWPGAGTSVASSEGNPNGGRSTKLEAGNFINDIGFFTETPQADTVVSASVIKTLTLSQSAYKMIAQDHPGSIGKILANLLTKAEEVAEETGKPKEITLTKRLEVLRAGSVYDLRTSHASQHPDAHGGSSQLGTVQEEEEDNMEDMHRAVASIQAKSAVIACRDVIKMHIDKLNDDHTTRFLFGAARDCTATITLMCDQGFDPNSADYDQRTALMVSSMKGNTAAVKKLLEYQCNPNMVDMHGTSALYEAAKNGHEETMEVLMEHGATLCMSEATAASVMCQTVFDGDTKALKRLLKAKIQVNAGDYDKRTAVHIAAAEGNLTALKVLVEFGADLSVRDRWNNTVMDEAKSGKAEHIVEYLKGLEADTR